MDIERERVLCIYIYTHIITSSDYIGIALGINFPLQVGQSKQLRVIDHILWPPVRSLQNLSHSLQSFLVSPKDVQQPQPVTEAATPTSAGVRRVADLARCAWPICAALP